jgi:hypothetical protein
MPWRSGGTESGVEAPNCPVIQVERLRRRAFTSGHARLALGQFGKDTIREIPVVLPIDERQIVFAGTQMVVSHVAMNRRADCRNVAVPMALWPNNAKTGAA